MDPGPLFGASHVLRLKSMKRGRGKSRRSGSNEPVRFAVIGQGYFAQGAVLPGFKEADGCELHAIFSEDETKLRALRRKYGVAAALGYDHLRARGHR
jgi:hypothetical protein